VGRAIFVEDAESALRKFLGRTFDDRHEALFELQDVPLAWRAHASGLVASSARVMTKAINMEEIEVRASERAWVVIPTNWDPGWRALVNGREVPVIRANYVFQAVPVPSGFSKIRLTYRPAGFRLGGIVSLGAIAVLLLFVVRRV
jgi:uncharacterized membrane protein YfhO